jgi:hypothetical protein
MAATTARTARIATAVLGASVVMAVRAVPVVGSVSPV